MLCRFEDRLSGRALELLDFSHRISAHSPEELPLAFERIEAARQQGYWVALLLDYELGEWLEPAVTKQEVEPACPAPPSGRPERPARLNALVYRHAAHEAIHDMAEDTGPVNLHAEPLIAKDQYLKNVQKIRASIGRGELYQTNYTFPIKIATSTPPTALYRAIAARHPAAHAAYIEDGTRSILSFSPELFLRGKARRLP